MEGRKEMFYLMTHLTHFIYSYHSDSERGNLPLPFHHYSFQLAATDILYAPSNKQDTTYHGHCYTTYGALAGTIN